MSPEGHVALARRVHHKMIQQVRYIDFGMGLPTWESCAVALRWDELRDMYVFNELTIEEFEECLNVHFGIMPERFGIRIR